MAGYRLGMRLGVLCTVLAVIFAGWYVASNGGGARHFVTGLGVVGGLCAVASVLCGVAGWAQVKEFGRYHGLYPGEVDWLNDLTKQVMVALALAALALIGLCVAGLALLAVQG